jgi:hypothetical protein
LTYTFGDGVSGGLHPGGFSGAGIWSYKGKAALCGTQVMPWAGW